MSSVIAMQASTEQPEAPTEQLEAPVEQVEVSTWTYTDYTCSYAVDQAGNIRDASTFNEDELHQIQHA